MVFLGKKKVEQEKMEKRSNDELVKELQEVQKFLERANENFSYVVDPELIDCCIYELKAGQMRYKFLLKQVKEQEGKDKLFPNSAEINCR